MRILFSAVSAPGHLLPLLPLADAARLAGHDVAFVTGGDMAELLDGRTLLSAGPSLPSLVAETARRTGGDPTRPTESADAAVDMFTSVRVDLTFDDALDKTKAYRPDLLVCEAFDFVGPMLAASLGIPWAALAIIAPLAPELSGLMRQRAELKFEERGLRPSPRGAFVDPIPDLLCPEGVPSAPDRIAQRPVAHGSAVAASLPPLPSLPAERPRVLVTLGTSVHEPELLAGLVASIAAEGLPVLVTVEPGTVPENPRVHEVGFVPLAQLLPEVDVVVGAGGMGTLAATLAAGLPSVLRPVLADQPWNAERVAGAGLGVVIDDPAEAGTAVRSVLAEPAYRAATTAEAEAIAARPGPDEVLDDLLRRLVGRDTR